MTLFAFLKKTYHWVISWADHRLGEYMLALIAFAESSVFFIPPDVLLIPLALGKPRKSFHYALICTVASVLGGILGYCLGYGFWTVTQNFFFNYIVSEASFARVGALYEHYAFWAVFVAGFTPIPYKVFTIAAGVFSIPFYPFVLASIVGRGGRFFLVSFMIYVFGEKVKDFLETRFELATVLFAVLLVAGFFCFKFVF